MDGNIITQSQLGRKSQYPKTYDKKLLLGIERQTKRNEIGFEFDSKLYGYDLWNCYEVSWLNPKGKPEVRIASILYDAHSNCLVESKSLKLYLNSFNNEHYNENDLIQIIQQDLTEILGVQPEIEFLRLDNCNQISAPPGICLDTIQIDLNKTKNVRADFLTTKNNNIENQNQIREIVFSDLLKSNCLVTNQPDWGTVVIEYEGDKICHQGLLKYIISFRNHNEFHEQCIERIFFDSNLWSSISVKAAEFFQKIISILYYQKSKTNK